MKLLILFLLVVSTHSKTLFDRACAANPADCTAADFEFSKEYLGRGVCGGMSYQKRQDPSGKDVNILDECGFWDTCQFPDKLDFDCTDVLFQANKDACYDYIGTGTCQYSPLKGWIAGLMIGGIILLIVLGIQWWQLSNSNSKIKKQHRQIEKMRVPIVARKVREFNENYKNRPVLLARF